MKNNLVLSNQETIKSNRLKKSDQRNCLANYGVCGIGSDVPMGRLVMQRCARDGCEGGGDSRMVDVDVYVV